VLIAKGCFSGSRYQTSCRYQLRYLIFVDSKAVRGKGSEVATSEPLFSKVYQKGDLRGESDHATSHAAAGAEGSLLDRACRAVWNKATTPNEK